MSNVRALVYTRSIAFMHYGLRKASRVRFLLVSRCAALHVQLPQCTMALDSLAYSLSAAFAQHRARGNTEHWMQRKVSAHESMLSHGACNGVLDCAAFQA